MTEKTIKVCIQYAKPYKIIVDVPADFEKWPRDQQQELVSNAAGDHGCASYYLLDEDETT